MKNAMKLSEYIANIMQKETRLKEEIVVLHINHCMDNSFDFSEILCRVFHKVVFVGVPYNDKVVPEGYSFCDFYGIQQNENYSLFEQGKFFGKRESDFVQAVESLIERALEKEVIPLLEKGKRLLIIEDGGYHYSLLRRMSEKHPVLKDHVVGSVEQTTSGTLRGHKVAREQGFLYPQTSVVRSDIKMNIESRFIAHRVVEELSLFLYTVNAFFDFHNILLLGYGVVGRRIAQDLRGRCLSMTAYDKCPQILQAAQAEGIHTISQIDRSCFGRNTVLIGNTGCQAFTKEMLTEFFRGEAENLYLASSSSQDEEFRVYLDMLRGEKEFPQGAVLVSCQENDYVNEACFDFYGEKKKIYLVAKGLPVNFYRKDVISLTNSVIDLVFAEMLSMGEELCSREDMEQRLYLYGEDTAFFQSFSEEVLIRAWLKQYGYYEEEDIKALMDKHPETELLRRMTRDRIN